MSDDNKHVDGYRLDDLWALCQKFISDNKMVCPESIYQLDYVQSNAMEFIEEICNLVGYYKDGD